MGIRIKLKREGQIKKPSYKVVVLESRKGIRTKPIETLGFLKLEDGEPYSKLYLVLNFDQLSYWLSKGAKLTDRLQKLLVYSK